VALAREVAARALTLVRDDASLLPLRLGADARVAAVMPKPADLTPADTSSRVVPGLAPALRRHISAVDELLVPTVPAPDDIAAIVEATLRHEVVVLGTIGASFVPQQADLARALLAAHPRVVTVALRTPWDLATYAESRTHMCTYSILQESLDALADALLGHASFPGTLPVRAEDVTGVERRA
jgi:beta-N-acetylhexosaminidase